MIIFILSFCIPPLAIVIKDFWQNIRTGAYHVSIHMRYFIQTLMNIFFIAGDGRGLL